MHFWLVCLVRKRFENDIHLFLSLHGKMITISQGRISCRVTNRWAHPVIEPNALFSARDSRMLSLDKSTLASCAKILLPRVTRCDWNMAFRGTCKPLLFWPAAARRRMESELESQGPICQMNAISFTSGYRQCCCFPFRYKWNNKSHDNITMNSARAKI